MTAELRVLRGVTVTSRSSSEGFPDDVAIRPLPVLLAGFGLGMFVVGSVLLIAWGGVLGDPERYRETSALALTHVFSLGFVTSLIIAVLYQFIPAAFHANVRGVWRTRLVVTGYAASVILFTVSLCTGQLVLAAVAGPLLGCSIGLFLAQMAGVVIRAKRRTLESGFHISAFLSLASVIVLGSLLATSLPSGWMGDPGRLLAMKIVLAVAGWIGLILTGVSYHTVRGLNGSSVHPRFVLPTFISAAAGVTCASAAEVLALPPVVRVVATAPLAVAACVFSVDVVRMIRSRAPRAATVTWLGHICAALLLLACSVEAVLGMSGSIEWSVAAVCGVLGGVAPVAIVANGNRIIPILIANRYKGRGREALSAGRWGRVSVPAAMTLLGLAWFDIQLGVMTHSALAIRAGGAVMLMASIAFASAAARQALIARRDARVPEWTIVGNSSTGAGP